MICKLEDQTINFRNFEKCFIANLQNPLIHYVVAIVQEQAAGFISVHLQSLLHHAGPVAEIQELFVLDNFRQQSIGRLLFTEAQQWARKKSAVQIEVTALMHRAQAELFYKAMGFQPTHFKFSKLIEG